MVPASGGGAARLGHVTLNYHVENRMIELGIDPLEIGVG
jgi:hypothetical protein